MENFGNNQRLYTTNLLYKNKSATNLVLLPTLNEEDGIGPTINELKECFNTQNQPHFLVVDGNSKDQTVEIAKRPRLEVITQTGKGKGNADH